MIADGPVPTIAEQPTAGGHIHTTAAGKALLWAFLERVVVVVVGVVVVVEVALTVPVTTVLVWLW